MVSTVQWQSPSPNPWTFVNLCIFCPGGGGDCHWMVDIILFHTLSNVQAYVSLHNPFYTFLLISMVSTVQWQSPPGQKYTKMHKNLDGVGGGLGEGRR